MSCPCTRALVFAGRLDRRVAFLPALEDADSRWPRYDVIFTAETPQRGRHGRARVVCCAEPGYTRLGAGVVVLYGKNTKALGAAFREAGNGQTVIVLLYDGTRTSGGALAKIEAACEADGRSLSVHRFAEVCGLYIDPRVSADPVILARHGDDGIEVVRE